MSKKNRSLIASKVIPTIDPATAASDDPKSLSPSHYAESIPETRQSNTHRASKNGSREKQPPKVPETDRYAGRLSVCVFLLLFLLG